MPEELSLAVYLERRGSVKALTRIEAEAFRVPYPLLKGWATRHGATVITQDMLSRLQEQIGRAKSSTAQKAQRGLDGVEGVATAAEAMSGAALSQAATARVIKASKITGFVVRHARRYRMPKPVR